MPGASSEDVSVQCTEEMGCWEAMAGEGRSLKELAAGGGEEPSCPSVVCTEGDGWEGYDCAWSLFFLFAVVLAIWVNLTQMERQGWVASAVFL